MKLVAYIKTKMQIMGVLEQGTDKNTWISDKRSNGRTEKISNRIIKICTPCHKISGMIKSQSEKVVSNSMDGTFWWENLKETTWKTQGYMGEY